MMPSSFIHLLDTGGQPSFKMSFSSSMQTLVHKISSDLIANTLLANVWRARQHRRLGRVNRRSGTEQITF